MKPATCVVIGLLVASLPPFAQAADPCDGFKWPVTAERALFATEPQPLAAGTSAETAPRLEPGRLTVLALQPQGSVHFAAPPGKSTLADGAAGGLVRFRVATAGSYLVSLDRRFWVDIVAAGQLIASTDFSGAPGCAAPRKVVRYALPADVDLLLQLSGAPDPELRLAITPAP